MVCTCTKCIDLHTPVISIHMHVIHVYRAVAHDVTIIAAANFGVQLRARVPVLNCADGTYACMYGFQKALDTVECGIILKQNSMGRHGE